MFAAKRLSNNTFDFGISSHDLAAIGFLGMIIFTLLIFRPCIVICSIRRVPRYQELLEQESGPPFADPELESVIRRRRRAQYSTQNEQQQNNHTQEMLTLEMSQLPLNSLRDAQASGRNTQADFESIRYNSLGQFSARSTHSMVTDSHQHSARSMGGTRRGGQGRRMDRPLHPIAAQLRKIAEEDAVRRERMREERQNS